MTDGPGLRLGWLTIDAHDPDAQAEGNELCILTPRAGTTEP